MGQSRGRRPAAVRVITAGRTHDHRMGHDSPADLMTRLGERVQVIGDCWLLDGNADDYVTVTTGYGHMNAHRFVYMEVTGDPLDHDMHVHHLCEHPGCIRPEHLSALTASEHSAVHARMRQAAIST